MNNGRYITALPVFNEATHLCSVLDEVVRYSDEILVVNDGSTDETADLLRARSDIQVVTHQQNQGYGAALKSAFRYAQQNDYSIIVTIDCDGQHSPQRIPMFVEKLLETDADIVSGSRYKTVFDGDSKPPEQRRKINAQITKDLNERLGFQLTDAFCGFKAYKVESVCKMNINDNGYAMPLELWVQAACLDLEIVELAVPLIYLDADRTFGGSLDDAEKRIAYYHDVIQHAIKALPQDCNRDVSQDTSP